MKWISVKDRFPDDDELILAYHPHYLIPNPGHEHEVDRITIKFGWYCRKSALGITHWMPMPESPKKGTYDSKATAERDGCLGCGYRIHSLGVAKLPDCNTCGKEKICKYMPELGDFTRINCPHWEKEGDADA